MRSRLLSIAIVSVFSASAQAQLPSDRHSPINFIGRFAGFGYSDGYHACKDSQSKKSGFPKPWESMSATYGVATAPPTRPVLPSPVTTMPQYTHAYHTQHQALAHQESMSMQSPAQPLWLHPSNNSPQVLSETVPPAPLMLSPQSQPSQTSPSDLRKPSPTIQSAPLDRSEPLPPPPMVPSTRAPSLTRSLVVPQAR